MHMSQERADDKGRTRENITQKVTNMQMSLG